MSFIKRCGSMFFAAKNGDRNAIDRTTAHAGLAAFEVDLEANVLKIAPVGLDELLDEALRLTDKYTVREGIRSMDTLHLAAAKLLGCTEFLSFDKLQRRVAELEGFSVPALNLAPAAKRLALFAAATNLLSP